MTSGSADTSLKTELRASAMLVLATKIPLLITLWFFELTTRPLEAPFTPVQPVAFGALARWQARETLLGALAHPSALDPFTGRPFAAMLPAVKGVYAGLLLLAQAIHRPGPVVAVIASLLLLVPSIALVRGALPEAGEREKTAVSLMILLGPGAWFVSSPGSLPLFLFAVGAAFYGLERRRPIWLFLGVILAPLADPAGLAVVPAVFAGPRENRVRNVVAGIVGAAGVAALVAYYLIAQKYPPVVAFEPLHTWMSWPGGQLGQLSQMFGNDPRQPMMIYDFVAAIFVAGGIGLAWPRLPEWLRIFALTALVLMVRDLTSAPAIAVWCFPAVLGWARLLDRVKPAQWLGPVVMTGVFPIFLFAFGNVWDFLELGPPFPLLAGEFAWAAQRVPGLSVPTGPAVPLAGRTGAWQRFEYGVVQCTPGYGCHAIEGIPYARFVEAGGLATCGAPTADREKVDGVWSYPFERGVVRSQPGAFTEAVCGDRKASSAP